VSGTALHLDGPHPGRDNQGGHTQPRPAAEIEQLVAATVRQHIRITAHERDNGHDTPELNDKDLISTQVARVDVKSDHLVVRLAITSEQQGGEKIETDVLNHHDGSERFESQIAQTDASTNVLRIPGKRAGQTTARDYSSRYRVSPRPDKRPIRAETRAKLIASIAKGRQWLEEWTAGIVTNAPKIARHKAPANAALSRKVSVIANRRSAWWAGGLEPPTKRL